MVLFCKHKWVKISEHTTESKVEMLSRMGATDFSYFPSWLNRKHIVILKCTECGKVKKFVEYF